MYKPMDLYIQSGLLAVRIFHLPLRELIFGGGLNRGGGGGGLYLRILRNVIKIFAALIDYAFNCIY